MLLINKWKYIWAKWGPSAVSEASLVPGVAMSDQTLQTHYGRKRGGIRRLFHPQSGFVVHSAEDFFSYI